MIYDDTLLGRCLVAYSEVFGAAITSQAGELAGWSDDTDHDDDEETWDNHPSLTPEQRNPGLR